MEHIYIIEDDMSILEGLTFLFEKNYIVTAINDARIALDKLQSEQPDLILLDLLMPGLNGTAFIEAFSEREFSVPILVITACRNVSTQLTMVAGVITKPFQIKEIETKIEQVLKKNKTVKNTC